MICPITNDWCRTNGCGEKCYKKDSLGYSTSTQHEAKLPVISRSISSQIAQLRGMIESGYGRTGKPLSVKRLKKLKDTLAQLEASQNGL